MSVAGASGNMGGGAIAAEALEQVLSPSMWWSSPANFTFAILMPASVALLFYDPVYFDLGFRAYAGLPFAACLCALAALCVGCWLPRMVGDGATPATGVGVAEGVLDAFAAISIAAYVVLFHDVIVEPTLVTDVILGAKTSLRDDISTIPGVTTTVQFGVAFSSAYGLNLANFGRIPRRHHVFFGVLVALAVFRTVMWSERLALVEFLAPALLWGAARLARRGGPVVRSAISIAPFLVLIFSFALFATAESFRSWRFYRDQDIGFFSFMLDRWIGYYLSSLNNGALLIASVGDHGVNDRLVHVLSWLYQLPAFGPFLATAVGADRTFDDKLLATWLNPEFNAFSGVYPVLADFGVVGGVAFFFLFGIFLSGMHNGFKRRDGLGALVYPTLFVALLELLRIPYVFSTRYVYVLAGCAVAYCFRRHAPSRPAHDVPTPSSSLLRPERLDLQTTKGWMQ
jgi:hypothetical protein